MKLKTLLHCLPNIKVKGPKEVTVTSLSANSKAIFPGNLFVAKQGKAFDGNAFIREAISSGAKAVLTDMYDPANAGITQIITPDVAAIEPIVAARYYENPSKELLLVGVTGTNGKTTSSYLVQHLLDSMDLSCGMIGTIEYMIGSHRYEATRTTPDVITNHRLLREMVRENCKASVMEVTSHGLDQGRVDEIAFDIGVFTNLSQDHLDYHGDMETYFKAKRKLFARLGKGPAIVNVDDPWGRRLLGDQRLSYLTYAIDEKADIQASHIALGPHGTTFQLHYDSKQVEVQTNLVGRFNVYNSLVAAAVAISQGASLELISHSLGCFKGIPGRLEKVENELGLNVFVDFCHTDDALKNVLETLQEVKKGALITVFGCGGDRDRTKRPKMARVAEELSDYVILTSDNPRSEDPASICEEAAQGFQQKGKALIEVDRRQAIYQALKMANPEDTVLIAGKGHEPYQILAHETVAFDDRVVVKEAGEKLEKERCLS